MYRKLAVKENIYIDIKEYKKDGNYKKIVIFTHGICEYKERYQTVAEYLIEQGYLVVTYDLRGHGKSDGKRGWIDHYLDFVEDLHKVVELYKSEYPELPIVLVGHSLGGLIVNLYNVTYNDCEKIVSIGAPGIFMTSVKALRLLPLCLIKNIKMKNIFTNKLTSSKEYNDSQIGDENSLKYMTLQLCKVTLVKGVKHLQKNLKNANMPIYYLHGKADKIVPVKSSIYLNKNCPKSQEIHLFDKLGHEILNEPDKKYEIFELLDKIIEK